MRIPIGNLVLTEFSTKAVVLREDPRGEDINELVITHNGFCWWNFQLDGNVKTQIMKKDDEISQNYLFLDE